MESWLPFTVVVNAYNRASIQFPFIRKKSLALFLLLQLLQNVHELRDNVWLMCKELSKLETHQCFEEHRDLPCEHSQVQEPCGDLVIVLREMTVSQVLQNLNVLLVTLHVT